MSKKFKMTLKAEWELWAGLHEATYVAGALALARAILSGRDNEITCAECVSWLPTYVEERNLTYRPLVAQHLAFCPSCAAAHDVLREAMALTEDKSLVEPPTYPQFQVPRSKRP